ncbi:MAG: tyrosine-protein phosphatase [Anaerolineae bacterium]|nr:tyrosine-protein phosphatase [Anaerolineae bacterium]
MDSPLSPADLIIPLPVEAWVERPPGGDYLIRLAEPAGRVAVCVGETPEAAAVSSVATAIVTKTAPAGVSELRMAAADVALLGGRRPCFLLDLDGRRLVVAERTLSLAGGVNFRDIGGYRTADGRVVRWGRVYRAGSLAELADDDIALLAALGLRLSCDLRSTAETVAAPDRLPPGAVARHTPVVVDVHPLRRFIALIRKRHRVRELLQDAYITMLDQNGPLFADILRAAADPVNLPLVIHCTAGKDRTGLAVALLLLTLGVPEETVIADYTLSNHAYEVNAERIMPEMERLMDLGFSREQLRPFLLADARTLAAALAHLRRRHGSPAGYLRHAGLDDATVERLRAELLTPINAEITQERHGSAH